MKEIKKMKREIIPLSKDDYSSTQSKLELKMSIDDATDTSSEDTNSEVRENWGGRFEFLLACIGYSVGLGKHFSIKVLNFIFFK